MQFPQKTIGLKTWMPEKLAGDLWKIDYEKSNGLFNFFSCHQHGRVIHQSISYCVHFQEIDAQINQFIFYKSLTAVFKKPH